MFGTLTPNIDNGFPYLHTINHGRTSILFCGERGWIFHIILNKHGFHLVSIIDIMFFSLVKVT